MRGNGWRAVARLLFLVVCLGLGLGPSAVAAAPPTVTFPSQFNTTLRPDQGFKFVVRIQTDPGATIQSWAFLVNGVDVTRDFEAAIASGAVQTTIERDAEADVRTYTVPQISLSTGQYQVRLTVTSPGTAAGVGLWSVTVSPDARTLSPAQEAFLADHVPGFLGPELYTRTCLYTIPPDHNASAARRDAISRVSVAVGAGHAFKFAALIGRIMTELALDGETPLPIDAFAIDRPALRDPEFEPNYRL